MDPRKATASVSYNGKRIDTKLAEYLQSFSYTDVASGESDSLSLNINDRDRKWIKSWFPSKGDTMAATIIMKNWSKEGDTQKLSCGSFVIDDFSFSGTPVKLKLEALALPADSSFKETQRTKTYRDQGSISFQLCTQRRTSSAGGGILHQADGTGRSRKRCDRILRF